MSRATKGRRAIREGRTGMRSLVCLPWDMTVAMFRGIRLSDAARESEKFADVAGGGGCGCR